MNERKEEIIVVIVAFFVLFSALLDPRISTGLAFSFIIALAVYKLVCTDVDMEAREKQEAWKNPGLC